MKSNKLASISLVLWVATIAVFAWFFVHGNTEKGRDGRSAIVLQSTERDLILSEMRGLLSATQGVLDGANQGDVQLIVKAASDVGMKGAADVNPALMAKLPLEFKSLGMSVHRDMDDIAKAAASGTATADILKMTAATMNKCIACHSAWQLKSAQ